MKQLDDYILLQEILSGHTNVVSTVKSPVGNVPGSPIRVLIVSDIALDTYLSIIKSWFDLCQMNLELETSSVSDYMASPYHNSSRIDIKVFLVFSANNQSIEFFEELNDRLAEIKNESILYSNFRLASKDYMRESQIHFVEFRENITGDIFQKSLSFNEIQLICHELFSVISRISAPRFTKLLMVDLDNTIYKGEIAEGVIGEISFSEKHFHLIEWLSSLKNEGIFIEAVSRNSPTVLELLREYEIFKHFESSITKFNFTLESKGQLIRDRIEFYNFTSESVSYIDDNPGELTDALLTNPAINTFRIMPDASNWNLISKHIFAYSQKDKSVSSFQRLNDLKSNRHRNQIKSRNEGGRIHKYLESQIEILVGQSVETDTILKRCVDLSQRTNQFNFSNRRLNLEKLKKLLSKGFSLVVCSLKDRFADSGIIMFALIEPGSNHTAKIYELCLSCRAMGRDLESILIQSSLQEWQKIYSHDVNNFEIEFESTSRNIPAKIWLQENRFFQLGTLSLEYLTFSHQVQLHIEDVVINVK